VFERTGGVGAQFEAAFLVGDGAEFAQEPPTVFGDRGGGGHAPAGVVGLRRLHQGARDPFPVGVHDATRGDRRPPRQREDRRLPDRAGRQRGKRMSFERGDVRREIPTAERPPGAEALHETRASGRRLQPRDSGIVELAEARVRPTGV